MEKRVNKNKNQVNEYNLIWRLLEDINLRRKYKANIVIITERRKIGNKHRMSI